MRKLASIQKVLSIEPINGADAIDKATILGWQLVVKKGEFQPGDLAVYCEIDSILPDKPEFSFLKSRRIKTVRLRGQVSQGIAFPLSILPEGDYREDQDVTDIMGVVKYEPEIPACLAGVIKAQFPSFIPKTDETRVQVLQNVLTKYKGAKCYVTEKIDGSSATFYMKDGVFGVCSRNIDLVEDENNSFWKAARAYRIEEILSSYPNTAIQGELYGEGIQGNKLKIKGQKLAIFNLFNINEFKYEDYHTLKSWCEVNGLEMAPVLSEEYELSDSILEIIDMAIRKSVINPDVWAEGIVVRPHQEYIDLMLSNMSFNTGRVSFKAINPEFLLKYGE